uniref:CSON001462 protein n=1 Tax=Culicoides sonorensis TaxID=179676 RepID=A0A336MGP2_CULSO
MKFLITLSIIVAGVLAGPPPPEMVKIITDCLASSALTATPDEVKDILHMKVPIDSQPKKCFIKCFGEKTFVLDNAGKPNSTFLKSAQLPHCFDKTKMTDAVITECGAKTGATPCDVGFEVGKCLWEKAGNPMESSEEE